MRKMTWFCLLLVSRVTMYAQTGCAVFHNGIFYAYPKNTNYRYTEYFDDNLQHEINNTTGDTALWAIKWNNDCEYESRYIAGSVKTDDKMTSFLKKHTLVTVIENVTPSYYFFKVYVDSKKNHEPIQEDTMWMNEKTIISNNTFFEYLPDTSSPSRQHLTDTSKFALLYVYRPGKIALSFSSSILYLDDNALCLSRNNSGYVFKILKEGNYTLRTSYMKDSVQLPVDFHFGKRYYIKSEWIWGLQKHIYNFRLALTNMDAATGSKEFSEVKMRP